MDTIDTIKEQLSSNPVLIYMKGAPNAPQCGFSARAVQALMACGEKFAYVDILQNPDIRAELPKYANWPTFPQIAAFSETRMVQAIAGFFMPDIDGFIKHNPALRF